MALGATKILELFSVVKTKNILYVSNYAYTYNKTGGGMGEKGWVLNLLQNRCLN